jgi:hypothetical protein
MSKAKLKINGNKVNLCDSCDIPLEGCDGNDDTIVLGDGADENIAACSAYKPVVACGSNRLNEE